MGQFFRQYLEPIKLNDVHVDWKSMYLGYLTEDNFVKHFASLVAKAKPIHGANPVLKAYNIDGDVRIQYNDQANFEQIARQFGIFEEWKVSVMEIRSAQRRSLTHYRVICKDFRPSLLQPEAMKLKVTERAYGFCTTYMYGYDPEMYVFLEAHVLAVFPSLLESGWFFNSSDGSLIPSMEKLKRADSSFSLLN